MIQSLDAANEENGHARNIVFLKDEKYDIEGIYLFDTTWDSKRKNQGNDFLSSYQYFAKTKDFFETNVKNYMDKTLGNFNSKSYNAVKKKLNKDGVIESEELLTLNALSNLVDDIRIVDPQIHYKRLIGITPDIPFDNDKVLRCVKRYSKLINSSINAETFLDALIVVRGKQNLENADKYPLSAEDLYDITMRSKFEFYKSNETILLNSILGDEPNPQKELRNGFIMYARHTDLKNRLNEAKIKTKTL